MPLESLNDQEIEEEMRRMRSEIITGDNQYIKAILSKTVDS